MRLVPCSYQLEFCGPGFRALTQPIEQLGKSRPVFRCRLGDFDLGQHVSCPGVAFYCVENFVCSARPNTGQQLQHSEPRNPIARVLTPPQRADQVLDVGGFKKFEAAVLYERNVAPGKLNLKLGTVVGSSEQHRLRL